MTVQRLLVDRAEVAALLGMRREKLYRCLANLMAHPANPFPRPVLGRGSGARWDPNAISYWIAAGGEAAEAAPCGHGIAVLPSDGWAQRLDARALELAQP